MGPGKAVRHELGPGRHPPEVALPARFLQDVAAAFQTKRHPRVAPLAHISHGHLGNAVCGPRPVGRGDGGVLAVNPPAPVCVFRRLPHLAGAELNMVLLVLAVLEYPDPGLQRSRGPDEAGRTPPGSSPGGGIPPARPGRTGRRGAGSVDRQTPGSPRATAGSRRARRERDVRTGGRSPGTGPCPV